MLFQLSKVFAQLLLFGKMSRLAAYCCPVGLEATVIHSCLRPRDGTVLIFKIFSTLNECIFTNSQERRPDIHYPLSKLGKSPAIGYPSHFNERNWELLALEVHSIFAS